MRSGNSSTPVLSEDPSSRHPPSPTIPPPERFVAPPPLARFGDLWVASDVVSLYLVHLAFSQHPSLLRLVGTFHNGLLTSARLQSRRAAPTARVARVLTNRSRPTSLFFLKDRPRRPSLRSFGDGTLSRNPHRAEPEFPCAPIF